MLSAGCHRVQYPPPEISIEWPTPSPIRNAGERALSRHAGPCSYYGISEYEHEGSVFIS